MNLSWKGFLALRGFAGFSWISISGRARGKKASIMCTKSGSCETCIALDKKTYRPDKLPKLPYQGCTSALGCRCLYLADLGF